MIYSQHALLKNSKMMLIIVSFLSLFLSATYSEASNSMIDVLGLSGSIRPSYWQEDKNFNSNQDFLVSSIWLTSRPQEISGYKIFLDGYLQESDLSRESHLKGDLREIFIEKSYGSFDFKIGRQITVWGRADKINPTDSFSSKDLKLIVTDDEDQRKGQGSFQTIYNFDEFRIVGIWQYEWRAPQYPVVPQAGIAFQNLTPDQSQNQFGFKIDKSGGEMDWSLSYFDGFNKVPDLKLLSIGPEIELGFEYSRIQVYGVDFAKSIGNFGLRGELAYTQTQHDSDSNPLKQNSNLFAVLGTDRTFLDNFNLNGQILYRQVFKFQDPYAISDLNLRTLALQEAITSHQTYEQQMGLSLRPSYKGLNDTLEIEMAYVTWFKDRDSIWKPKMTYAINDSLKIIMGAEVYKGSTDSFFGRIKDASSFFSEIRYLF